MGEFHPDAHFDFDPNDTRSFLAPKHEALPSPDGYDQPGFAIPSEGDFFDHRQPPTEQGAEETIYLYK